MENGTINMIGTTILGNCKITGKGDITEYLFKSLQILPSISIVITLTNNFEYFNESTPNDVNFCKLSVI